jgi:uncharacterized protein YkwD
MRNILAIILVLSATAIHAQGADTYLAQIRKYNEPSIFEDVRYKGMDWQHFYQLEEANDLVDPNNYDFDLMNAAVFFAVNKYRASKGIAALKFEPRFRDAASIHSDQMVRHHFFDHINRYDQRIAAPNNRTELCGYKGERIAENLAKSFMDPQRPLSYNQLADMVVKQLAGSYEHNQHMLDPTLDKLGCGLIFENKLTEGMSYFSLTQDFGRDWR